MLVRDHDDRVLLCNLTYKQDWDLPGGVVEVHESPRPAVARELEEELALDIKAGGLLLTDWLPSWSGWDDALCLVFDGMHDASIAAGRSPSRGRSAPRSSARRSRCASAARTSPPAGSSPRWRTSAGPARRTPSPAADPGPTRAVPGRRDLLLSAGRPPSPWRDGGRPGGEADATA